MKKNFTIFFIAIIIILFYGYFTYNYTYNIKYENIKANINKLIADNKKNHIIDSDFQISDEYNLSQLEALNKEVIERTFKKLNDDFEESKNLFELLKKENTSLYDEKKINDFDDLISNGESKIKNYSTKLEYAQLINLINDLNTINNKLIDLSNSEQKNKAIIGQAIYNAEQEINTTNKVKDDCFSKQENKTWKYNSEISKQYCNYLDLNTCNKTFNGFTMNNPKAVSTKLNGYTYVSLNPNIFKKNKLLYSHLKESNNVYAEVYESSYENYTIYKYNIIVIPKTYTLSCKFPK